MPSRLLFLLPVTFIFIAYTTPQLLFSTSVLVIKSKSDNGNDPCERLNCVPVLSNETYSINSEGMSIIDLAMAISLSSLEIEININQASPTGNYSFPWHLRVFSESGTELGRSQEVSEEIFVESEEFADIRSTSIEANLFGGIIKSKSQLEQIVSQQACMINECGYQYSDLNVYFKLYAGNFEIESTHQTFLSPNLEPNSSTQNLTIKTCECNENQRARNTSMKPVLIDDNQLIDPIHKNSIPQENLHPKFKKRREIKELFEVYPNPASSYAWLECHLPENQQVPVEILDFRGIIVRQLLITGRSTSYLDLTRMKSGVYFLRVKIQHVTITKKLVIHI